jgi:multisubunit Na+/H+ antiporter MnhF subunit
MDFEIEFGWLLALAVVVLVLTLLLVLVVLDEAEPDKVVFVSDLVFALVLFLG